MNHSFLIGITLFHCMADNMAKTNYMMWHEIAAMLSAPHAGALSHKSLLPLFSPWIYKDVKDPAVVNGDDRYGNPLQHFSDTHVRRHSPNLVAMTMLVLDFDRGRSISQIRELFSEWEHVFYTTLNHREGGEDKARVVLPLATPMPVADFVLHHNAMQAWVTGHGADSSTADIGRMFILPTVREENRHFAQSWHHEGALLDWHMFENMPKPVVAPVRAATKPLNGDGELRKLLPDDVLETANGCITVRDITRKISNVRCPSHVDAAPSEFVNITKRGTPFLVCKKCGTFYMERAQSDGIADGIAQIIAKKKRREGGVQW